MMAAMMLPAVSPLVSMYARSVRGPPGALTAFGSGYILVWAATGVRRVRADMAVRQAGRGAARRRPRRRGRRLRRVRRLPAHADEAWCLRHCRSPISHLLHYASYRGRTRHLRAGAHHGLVCVGCCWTLMVALLAVGMMNIPAMVVLALLITLEKQWRHGEMLAKVAGVAALVFAVAIAIDADLAPGLIDQGRMEMEMDTNTDMDMGAAFAS